MARHNPEHIRGSIRNVLAVHPDVSISELMKYLGLTKASAQSYYRSVVPMSIGKLELDVRSYNALRSYGIIDIQQLIRLTKKDLLQFKNLGRGSLRVIEEALSAIGLKLKD